MVAGSDTPRSFEACLTALGPLREQILTHPVYGAIRDEAALRCFMEHHVWAVWDFMSILKAIQARFTCVNSPWVPQGDPSVRRFVNEIVLLEESDETSRGFLSHFELYCLAVEEVGANHHPVLDVVDQLSQGTSLEKAFAACTGAGSDFSRQTIELVQQGSVAELVGVFAFSREELIPDLFRQVVAQIVNRGGRAGLLLEYLERHIEVDEGEHGPLARKMVEAVCGDREQDWQQVFRASEAALEARIALWDAAWAGTQSAKASSSS